ncbi:MAG: competence/damage-inducible protein A [Pirellulaceae bacterium]
MRAEIIAIGDELVSGQRLDTNTQWLSRELGDIGVPPLFHTTVGDDLRANVEVLRAAAQRADVVICTGGLGPTLDDLTRQAMAEAFGCPLELDEDSLAHIEAMFANRNRPMPERNRMQAMFPSGSNVVSNPHGSAPGIDLTVRGERQSRFFALPGVPAEMKQMWRESVAPAIESMNSKADGTIRFHAIKMFGIGESDVEVRLPDLIERERNPAVGITVSRATITLRIAGRAKDDASFQELIAPTVDEIQSAMGDLIFGVGEEEIQDVVLKELRRNKVTLATLEVGSASSVGDWVLASAGGGDEYRGSLACPTWNSAMNLLNIDQGTRESEGETVDGGEILPPDDATLLELAVAMRERMEADLSLVVGRYPSYEEVVTAANPFNPVFAFAGPGTQFVCRRRMGGHPDVLGARIGKTGLDLVRRVLCGLTIET